MRKWLRKALAALLAALLAGHGSAVFATETIQVATFIPPDQWNSDWAPQINYCKAQAGVELEHIVLGHGTFTEQIFLMATAGEMPDVLLIPPERVAPIVHQGLLENLDPWIERYQLDQSQWLPTAIHGTRFEGVNFGFAAYIVNYTYAYNPEILLQRGVAPPGPTEWVTWDQVRETARRTHVDQDGNGAPEVVGFVNGTVYVQFLPFVRQAGGEIYDAEGFVQFNSEPVKEALEFFLALNQEGIHQGARDLFWTGKAATERMGSWEVQYVLNNGTPVATAAGIQHKVKSDVAYPTAWAMASASDQKDAAWRFLTCVVSKEAQDEVVKRGLVPMRRDVDLPRERGEILQGFINTLEYSGSYPYHVQADFVLQSFDRMMPPVFAGQAPAASVLAELDRMINAYIRDERAQQAR